MNGCLVLILTVEHNSTLWTWIKRAGIVYYIHTDCVCFSFAQNIYSLYNSPFKNMFVVVLLLTVWVDGKRMELDQKVYVDGETL